MALWHRLTARQRGAALAAVALVVVVVVVVAQLGRSDRSPGAVASPSATASTGAPTPTPSPSGQATTVPTPGDASPTPSDEVPTPGAQETPGSGEPSPSGGLVPVPPLAQEPTVVELGGDPVSTPGGVRLSVAGIRAVTASGHGPGELSGPALAVQVQVVNDGTSAVDLVSAGVAVYFGADGVPASLVMSDEAAQPLAGTLAPGATATGTYIALVPADSRDLVAVVVQMGDAPAAIFEGPAPGA
jgi:hypothetical protein